jgi:predicted ATPase
VLGTYRPVEVIVRARPLHALKLDLMLHRQCWELPLQLLTAADVAQYLARRFGAGVCPEALALHRRTDGHPLFLVTVVDALVQQGLLREVAGHWQVPADLAAVEAVVPESVQQMIAQQFDALPAADRDVLEAASVAGLAHTVAVVAAGVEATDETVEARCTSLAQRGQFVQAHGVEEWPDGTVTGRYGFRHTLYQQVVYEQVPVGRRLRLHRQIGARLEAGYGAQAGERAAELARHFAAGRDHARAVTYLQQAAANALRRWAYAEALGHLQRAVALLPTLPDTPARRQQELAVYLTLGQTWIATKGAAAAEVEAAYTRAQELCAQVGELPQHFDVLRGLSRHYLMRAAYRKVQTLGAQRLRLAERRQDPELLTEAHASLGVAAYYLGELATAQAHFMQGLGVYDIQQHAPVPHYAQDSRGICLNVGAQTCWVLGYPDQALALQHQALAHARVLAHPFGLGMALGFAASLHLLRGEWSASQAHAEASRRLALEHDLGMMATQGMLVQGVALAAQGHHEAGLAQMRQAMAAIQAAGQEAGRLLAVAVLAEQYGLAGQVEAGLHVLSEALASLKPQEPRLWEPELHRVRGTLLLQAGGVTLDVRCQATEAEAETCFQQALALAQRQGARAFELRAATGLSRLWQRQGKHAEARALLAPLYGWFTEGFDTADLRAAKALLDELGA